MVTSILHISDLHLRENWHEEQGFVLHEFFEDLKQQLAEFSKLYVVFTGDILQEGKDPAVYEYFSSTFAKRLRDLGVSKDRLIVVPGNHDVDRQYTQNNFSVLKGIQERKCDETRFNNSIYEDQCDLIRKKFLPFLLWQETVSDWALTPASFCGRGFSLTDEVGIYCLNTALYSFGGLKDEAGNSVSDYQALPIETRRLHEWLRASDHKYRILAMHHPFDWLADWAAKELPRLCFRYFDLVLCGHVHEKKAFHTTTGAGSFVNCVAPALFSSKSEVLGYSILTIEEDSKNLGIRYRQWVEDRFVLGTALSRTDTGVVQLAGISTKDVPPTEPQDEVKKRSISAHLRNNFERSLKCYSSLPAIWVVPNVSTHAESAAEEAGAAVITSADSLVQSFADTIIKAPPQFGLSSLGHYLAHAAWERSQYVMVIDATQIQNHEAAIQQYVECRANELGLEIGDVSAIVLDEPGAINNRKINNIKRIFPKIPLIVLLRVQDYEIDRDVDEKLTREFRTFYLWSLERPQIREIVRQFIDAGNNLEEEAAVQRLIEDIANLNLHRTPLNCLTLLTVYEKQIDYSPTNRTDMFERFLFLIFYAYKKNPDYSSFPDMKDALAVLGAFCEGIIRTKNVRFKKGDFILTSTKFCDQMSINVDCSQLFEVMNCENIIVKSGDYYVFRYVHWIYFFGAHRMYHDATFREFVLSDTYYINFPEIVEFYSGIDRRREELLMTLIRDLRASNDAFEARTGIDAEFDPYHAAHWKPSKDELVALKSRLKDEAAQSSLPVSIKDQIADETYDRALPYNQEIQNFVRDSSLLACMLILIAAARALRNSDYVRKETKAELLTEILRAWTKEVQVLFLLSPLLARQRAVQFHNILFFLASQFDQYDGEELWRHIVAAVPTCAVSIHEKDIASPRMMPLFKTVFENTKDGPAAFLLAGVIISSRPQGWGDQIAEYIKSLPKNSYYLLKIHSMLRYEHRYGFIGAGAKEQLLELLSMTIAKHETGAKSPNRKLLEKVKQSLRGKMSDDTDSDA